ncbi:MAG: flagellar biosynthetic protein FliO [Parachlamydiaceae bacterium]|nr:flagellar biosynthetic protein FliO [Parachlamydiaceae bacterium]
MHYIIYTLFLFVNLVANPHLLTAAPDISEPSEKIEASKNDVPLFKVESTEDHGYTFPLEDLVENPDKHNDRFYTEFLNMLATLGLVIGIILIAAWFLRRLLNTRLEQINTTSSIKIIDKRALSPKSAVYLLEIYDKIIAIAETQTGITQLGEFKIPAEPEMTKEKMSPSFNQILENKP